MWFPHPRARTLLATLVLTLVAAAHALAFGQQDTPPTLTVMPDAASHISPAAGDGVQDALVVTVSAGTEANRSLAGYAFTVHDDAGDLVFTTGEASELPEGRFGRAMARRRVELAVPGQLTWSGTTTEGSPVAEGTYTYRVRVNDNLGVEAVSAPQTVVVDDTAPHAELSASYLVFSPNDDDSQDVLPIEQSGSVEARWVGEFLDSGGNVVARYEWSAAQPQQLAWDGTDGSSGARIADGVYAYRLASTDHAGNSFETFLEDIVIDSRAVHVTVTADRTHFSPNGDGVADSLELALNVPPGSGVREWMLRVPPAVDAAAYIVRGTGAVPERIIFDGRRDDGTVLADGVYRAGLEVLYRNGDRPLAETADFTIDATAPSVTVAVENQVFSPNRDGRKEQAIFVQQTSSELEWVGRISSSTDTVVRTVTWQGVAEPRFSWDGTDDAARPVADGAYAYQLSASDPAGNTTRSPPLVVTKDTSPTPIKLTVEQAAFSPNGDGVRDRLRLLPAFDRRAGLESAMVEIRNADGVVVFSRQLAATATAIDWDGTDTSGRQLPDGDYHATLFARYRNGNQPQASVGPLLLDRVAPQVRVTGLGEVFSPNGDGSKDRIGFEQDSSVEAEWRGEITDEAGAIVRTLIWKGRAPARFNWDGTDNRGQIVADGAYAYRLSAVDAAGNPGASQPILVQKDTRATPISVRVEGSPFSPNDDGRNDEVRIVPLLTVRDGLESVTVTIRDSRAIVVFREQRQDLPAAFVWTGHTEAGERAPEGEYGVTLEAAYANGNRPRVTAGPIVVDATPPRARLVLDNGLFSPDGDGRRDAVTIVQRETSREAGWSGVIRDARGAAVRSFSWDGIPPANLVWDGRDDRGTVVADGPYRYELSAQDAAGNAATFGVGGIRVDARPTPAAVAVAAGAFSPNDDGVQDTLTATLDVGVRAGIRAWSIDVEDAQLRRVATLAGGGPPPAAVGAIPATVAWDGKRDGVALAEDGEYRIALAVAYEKGNEVDVRSRRFRLDVTGPALTLALAPQPFSPDDDGFDDTLDIALRATDAGSVARWSLRVSDPAGTPFTAFAGAGAPPRSITWDGSAPDGTTVEAASAYPLVFEAVDEVGNLSTAARQVEVDVLVVREGETLRIRIPSIQFAPWSADLDRVNAEGNSKVLERLGQILNRLPQHRITVEGHGVRVYWYDEARGTTEEREVLGPLSQRRAEAVLEALVGLGVSRERMNAVGRGGTAPVVEHSDAQNRWKNRRVEFILDRR